MSWRCMTVATSFAGGAFACAVAPTRATAQDQPAPVAITGRVVDAASARPVPDASVALLGPDTVLVRANAAGRWQGRAMRPGVYQLRVRAVGFVPRDQAVVVASTPIDLTTRLDASPIALDEMVVTAARREQRLADVVTTTEVISRSAIERSGASDLATILLEQTGIELQGGHPAGSGVMLQGLGSERVLVLVDAQPVAGRISGVFDVSRIPTSMVERIEVVKGPQSTLYGSDAMGGVVNIITRTPRRGALGGSVGAVAGSQGRLDATSSGSLSLGDFVSAVDLSRRNTQTTPGIATSDGALARRNDLAAKLRWAPDSSANVEASLLALDERQRWRSGAFYNFGDNTQWTGRLTGTLTAGANRLTSTVSGSSFDHLSRGSSQSKPIAGDTGQRQLQRVYQAELLYNRRIGAHALDVGTQVRRDETESVRVPGGLRSITTLEPFAQAELATTSHLALLPGVRVSRSSQWGTHLTPRVAARLRATPSLTLRASVGEGFRAPDFKELYMFFHNTSAGYAVQGNPDLRPETSRNATAGAEWVRARGFVRGQVFWNSFRDFIETRAISQPGDAPLYEYQNVDDGRTGGVELESATILRGIRVEGGYSYLTTRDDRTGRSLLGRASHTARSGIGANLPLGIRASLGAVFTGRTPMIRDTASGAITSYRDAFFRADARVARSFTGRFRNLELTAGADNIFDRRPARWAGFTGRHVYSGLSWTFTSTNTDR